MQTTQKDHESYRSRKLTLLNLYKSNKAFVSEDLIFINISSVNK